MIVCNISSNWISNGKYNIITSAEGIISCTRYINDNYRISFCRNRYRTCIISTSGRVRVSSYERFVVYGCINGVGYTRSENKTKGYRVECWSIGVCFKSSINFEGVRIRGYTTGNSKYWCITSTYCNTGLSCPIYKKISNRRSINTYSYRNSGITTSFTI